MPKGAYPIKSCTRCDEVRPCCKQGLCFKCMEAGHSLHAGKEDEIHVIVQMDEEEAERFGIRENEKTFILKDERGRKYRAMFVIVVKDVLDSKLPSNAGARYKRRERVTLWTE